MDFRADFYSRDLNKNTIKGRGNAWVRKDGREIFADEIEVDLALDRAFANGSVRVKEGDTTIYATRGNYSLKGEDATLENATLIYGQTVLSAQSIRKVGPTQFEIEEGMYTNCNVVPYDDREAGKCAFDIKIYARRFNLTVDGYVHVHDGLFYAKELPVLFLPYFVVPAKSKRESGFLMPSFTRRDHLGVGYSLPYFWALGTWHDLTLTPTYWSQAGVHLGMEYNYAYSKTKQGIGKFFLYQYQFGDNRATPWIWNKDSKYAGILGEIGVDVHNTYSLWGRARTRQDIALVSDPYFTQAFPDNYGAAGDFQYLRSQIAFTQPSDQSLLTASVRGNQSLLNKTDTAIDRGGVVEAPDIRYHRRTTETFLPYLSFELDTRLTNFTRAREAFDDVPARRLTIRDLDPYVDKASPFQGETAFGYDGNDYIRTGRRLRLEPRLIGTVPLASGFQLQPMLTGGTSVYHFDLPSSTAVSQQYVEADIPFSLYMSRTYETEISGYEKIRHIIQPRVLYSSTIYRSDLPDHPFFTTGGSPEFSNPRFDFFDQNEAREYFQFDFNNRFLRRSGADVERFLLLQVSNQYFLKPSIYNGNQAGLGPLLFLMDMRFGYFNAQVQGSYKLTAADNGIHDSEWTGTVSYTNPSGDKVSMNTLFRSVSDVSRNDHTVSLSIYKTLPVFLDLTGSVEYSFRDSVARGYSAGFVFASKPRSCWSLSLISGRDAGTKTNYARLLFGLTFGGPATFSTGKLGS